MASAALRAGIALTKGGPAAGCRQARRVGGDRRPPAAAPGLLPEHGFAIQPNLVDLEPEGGAPPTTGNQLVAGDALTTLRDVRPALEDAVELALLDPPYNTRANFHHYRDQAGHDLWLEHRSKE